MCSNAMLLFSLEWYNYIYKNIIQCIGTLLTYVTLLRTLRTLVFDSGFDSKYLIIFIGNYVKF